MIWNQLYLGMVVAGQDVKEDDGQTMIEYALLAVFISIVAVVFLIAVGVDVSRMFDTVETTVSAAP